MRAQREWDDPDDGATDITVVERFLNIRQQSIDLCSPLVLEDYGVQPMADASPPKWHLAHTTWFFETFVLKANLAAYEPFHAQFEYLFNSYYNGVGKPYPRTQRGFLSRPTVAEVMSYREHVDQRVLQLLEDASDTQLIEHVVLGLHHEQQHQELLLTDLKYNFGHNPLYPVYGGGSDTSTDAQVELRFDEFPGGIVDVGAVADAGFTFDNEHPRHQVLLQPFKLANRLVTNADYLAFVEDGGYRNAELWLSEGWATVQASNWRAPLYWLERQGQWLEFRLDGLQVLDPQLPVVHVSGYEAAAYANWAKARLPTEFEWEWVAAQNEISGSFVESARFHPNRCTVGDGMRQLYGEGWQWTASSYGPYPGYRPLAGTLGEYNGKFMSSQLVLRGGSCATPQAHIRTSYRNFFYPPDRWQFSGIRLAHNV